VESEQRYVKLRVSQNGLLVDALLIDNPEAVLGNPQLHIALLTLHPDSLVMEIRQEAAPRLVMSVRHVISGHRSFSGDLADAGHG
jgi:hypothetical protein